MFRCLFFRLLVRSVECAFWYGGAAWSKDALSDERDDSLLLMPGCMFFVVVGGWLFSR